MKPHRPLIETIANNLKMIFEEGRYADRVIEFALKQNSKFGSRDRKFIAETTYTIVRNYRKLYESAGSKNPWMLIAAAFVLQEKSLPEWREFNGISVDRIQKNFEKYKNNFCFQESIPDWLDEIGRHELGEKWEEEVKALNVEAKVVLRVNTLKISVTELKKAFTEQEIETETVKGVPDALVLSQRQNIFSTSQFKNGFFEIQDGSSQLVAQFLQLESGMRVIDACAGAGGKSLHIAAILKNKGKIVSMDVEERKLNELKKRAARAGVNNIETKLIDSKTIKRLENSADRVLLDVPCSGLGVLKRNPDAKWKLSLEKIEKVKKMQEEILQNYSTLVKAGGKLVYATCSILPSENDLQVKKFINNNPNFSIEEEKIILPSLGFDGFYMCRFLRTN